MDMPVEKKIVFELNGRSVEALEGETILEAADRIGVEIPRLCYKEGIRADGNCRACVVEIDGERALAPSCCRYPTDDMKVTSNEGKARHSQEMVLELLLADMPDQKNSPYSLDSELDFWKDKLGVQHSRFPQRHQPGEDESHPAISVHLDACIQCTRCVRACREEQVNDVIGYAWRGTHSAIVFDLDDPMGTSSCVGCGECVQACPTGALMPAESVGLKKLMKWFPRSVLIAGLVAFSIITLRMENCCASKVARDLRIKAAYVLRGATDLTMFIIPPD